jgi:SAM-dependent methyltransferase
MSDDLHRHTRSAYRATADRYRARWAKADPLVAAKRHFSTLLAPDATILDVGCGPGRDLAWFSEAGHKPIGLDPVLEMTTGCPDGVPVIVGDVRRIPLAAGSVDGWWASASLLHLTADELPLALRELARVSRPAAVGFVAVKQGDGEELEPVEDGPHHRYFRYWLPTALDQALEDAGFDIIARETVDDSLNRRPWLHRIVRCSEH